MIDINTISLADLSVDELSRGYTEELISGSYRCVFCGEIFEKGRVYPFGDMLFTAERAVARHIDDAHGGLFASLSELSRSIQAVPEVQQSIIELSYSGKTDKQIADALGGKSLSTVRNHRFAIRKRENEAKLFLALMSVFGKDSPNMPRFVDYPETMPSADERSIVTLEEASVIESKYFDKDMNLKIFPRKEKEKLIIIKKFASFFDKGRTYSQKEVDSIIGKRWADYATLRRYLIDYRFLERMPDGSEYWLT